MKRLGGNVSRVLLYPIQKFLTICTILVILSFFFFFLRIYSVNVRINVTSLKDLVERLRSTRFLLLQRQLPLLSGFL